MRGIRTFSVVGATMATFLAFAQFRLIANVLGANYGQSVEAARGVVIGEPHWREVQNRVLAPYAVQVLSYVFPSYLDAHVAFTIITLAIAGALAFHLGRRHGGGLSAALTSLVAFELCFGFLLSRPWLYAWDYLDIITFLLFVEFVFAGRPWPWFSGLFLISIFNRESAFIIAAWMIFQPLCQAAFSRLRLAPPTRADWPMLVAGVAAVPIGIAVIVMLRNLLFVREIGPIIFADSRAHDEQFERIFINLVPNMSNAFASFTQPGYDMPFVIPLFVVIVLLSTLWMMWRFPVKLFAFGIACLGLITISVMVGVLFETRVLLNLIPVLLAALALWPRRSGSWALTHPSVNFRELWRRRGARAATP